MAMAGHLLQLKQPGRWSLSSESLDSVRAARAKKCSGRSKASLGPISSLRVGGERLRQGFVLLGEKSSGRDGFRNLGFGGRAVAAAAGGEGEAREAEVVADEGRPEEISSFPAEFKELTIDRGDPPNLYLYAAGETLITSSQCFFCAFSINFLMSVFQAYRRLLHWDCLRNTKIVLNDDSVAVYSCSKFVVVSFIL